MKASELLSVLIQRHADLRTRGLLAEINAVTRDIWSRRSWRFTRANHTFTPVQSTADGSVTHGSAIVGDGVTTWAAALIGGTVTVTSSDGTARSFTVASAAGGTTLTLNAVWPGDSQTGGVSIVVYQDTWDVPEDFQRARDLKEDETELIWRNPDGWRLDPVAGAVVLMCEPGDGVVMRLEYYRGPVKVTALGDDVDVPDWLADGLAYGVASRLLGYTAKEDADWQRSRNARALYEEMIAAAMKQDALEEMPESGNRVRVTLVE